MRKTKLGDVYAVKVPNGYKLYQWAYSLPKKGDYIRVFGGLYDSIPENIGEIVAGPHSYIISFYSDKAYRLGMAQLLDNYPVPEKYSFPEYMITFRMDMKGNIYKICFDPVHRMTGESKRFSASHMEELPLEFQDATLLNSCVTPNWLLYLFDIDFDLSEPKRFYPAEPGTDYSAVLQPYTDIVEAALEKDREKKKAKLHKM